MNYKKVFRNRRTRENILIALRIIPDKPMLKLLYKIKFKRKLNLKHPRRFSEKVQWVKLYERSQDMVTITDKYEVRDYIKGKGYESLLNECYGVYNSPSEIDFDKLPNRFVIKDTLGSGSVSVIVVKDKNSLDLRDAYKTMNRWVSKRNRLLDDGREWAYRAGKKHRIIIEKFLSQEKEDLVDYKFFCSNGEPIVIAHDKDRFSNHKRTFFDINWNKINVEDADYPSADNVDKPANLQKMIEIASDLSKGFSLLRVDFYNIDGRIIFGELTCYPHSGLVVFKPDEFDFYLGERIKLIGLVK